MADDRLRCALVGFGSRARRLLNCLSGHASLAVPYVVDPGASWHDDIREAGAEPRDDLQSVLTRDDIDAVLLMTSGRDQEAQVVECARAGKHVFCEMPLGPSAGSARRSETVCQQAGVTLGVGCELRFEPAVKALRAAIGSGEFGSALHAGVTFSVDEASPEPLASRSDIIDTLITLFGRVETVQALGARQSVSDELPEIGTLQFGFAHGVTASVSSVLNAPHAYRMHVSGTGRWIEIVAERPSDAQSAAAKMMEASRGRDVSRREIEAADALLDNLEAFRDACLGRASYPVASEQIVHNAEILEAIAESAERGVTARIPGPNAMPSWW